MPTIAEHVVGFGQPQDRSAPLQPLPQPPVAAQQRFELAGCEVAARQHHRDANVGVTFELFAQLRRQVCGATGVDDRGGESSGGSAAVAAEGAPALAPDGALEAAALERRACRLVAIQSRTPAATARKRSSPRMIRRTVAMSNALRA